MTTTTILTPEQANIDFEIRCVKGHLARLLRLPVIPEMKATRQARIEALEMELAGWLELALDAGLDPEERGY